MRKVFFDIGVGKQIDESKDKKWLNYEIIGFEPNTERFFKNVKYFQGILLNYAVTNVNDLIQGEKVQMGKKLPFFVAEGYNKNAELTTVKSVTLDYIDEKFGFFDEVAIWADIEGSELKMLKGATKVLTKTNWINVEVRNNIPTENWCTAKEVYDFLTIRGFKPNIKFKDIPQKGFIDVIFSK
jgi:FkbM family methyltransferase